jgi:hypothetical protein
MKFENIIRKGLVIVGFVTVMSLPATVRAQEITNTQFNDGTNVTALPQATSGQHADTSAPAALSGAQAMRASAAISMASDAQEAGVLEAPAPPRNPWVVASLSFGLGLVMLASVREMKRVNPAVKS